MDTSCHTSKRPCISLHPQLTGFSLNALFITDWQSRAPPKLYSHDNETCTLALIFNNLEYKTSLIISISKVLYMSFQQFSILTKHKDPKFVTFKLPNMLRVFFRNKNERRIAKLHQCINERHLIAKNFNHAHSYEHKQDK